MHFSAKQAWLMFAWASAACIAQEQNEEEVLASMYGDVEMVSIATGTEKPISHVPAVATVITARDIAAMGASDLNDVLETVPGLHVVPGIIGAPRFFIRGITSTYNSQTLLLVDGVPVNGIYLGYRTGIWGGMPVQAISRIEIMRGPGSALYGADAFAGIINVITKSAELETRSVGVGGGSYNTQTAMFQAGNSHDGTSYGFSLEWLKTDGPDETIKADAQTAFDQLAVILNIPAPAVSLAPGSLDLRRDVIEFRSFWKNEFAELRFGVQDRDNVGTGPGIGEALQPSGSFASTRYLLVGRFQLPHINEQWNSTAEISYYQQDQRPVERQVIFPPGAFFAAFPDGFIGEPYYKEVNKRAEFRSRYAGLTDQSLTIGIGWLSGGIPKVEETKNFDGSFAPFPEGLRDVSDTDEVFLPENKRHSQYLFIQDEWALNANTDLTVGLRRDTYSDFGSTTNPRAALVWSIDADWTLKFLYGEAFRAPAFFELYSRNNPTSIGNTELNPETIKTTEVSAGWRATENWHFDLTLFRYDAEDLISANPANSVFENQGNRTGDGLEFEVEYKHKSDLRWLAHFSYQDSVDESTDRSPGFMPAWELWQRLEWTANEHWLIAVQLNQVSDRERVEGDPRDDLEGYTQLDLNVRWQTSVEGLSASLRIGNALDDDIREPTTGPSGGAGLINLPNDYPMPERNFMLSVLLQW